jgi:hypothetical protein
VYRVETSFSTTRYWPVGDLKVGSVRSGDRRSRVVTRLFLVRVVRSRRRGKGKKKKMKKRNCVRAKDRWK